ncbi:hypothetical protein AGMMS50276_12230 [Synergistales bacterium]|nr:hypothetical protein AGMMS50276_12230 [Synergistales bacterium]
MLSDLLSGFLGEKIVVTEILNPEIPPESLLDKLSRMDLLALDSRGELLSAEVQVQYHEGFDDRVTYYGMNVHSDSVKKGDKYAQIRRTVMVNILAFRHKKLADIPHYHTTFKLRNEDASITLTEKFAIHYIEVPKIVDLVNNASLKTLSKEDKWVLYLNDCGGDVMERIVSEEPMIAKALTIGEIFNLDKAERQRARSRRDAVIGLNIAMGASYHSGMEKGREEGMEKGREEGMEKGREDTLKSLVRSMLARSMSVESISDILGISVDKIEALRV